MWIYVLKLQMGKFYVGKTNDVERRFVEHVAQLGSAWTKKYEPIEVLHFAKELSQYDEMNQTFQMMHTHGIENVRGGSFCSINLSIHEIKMIKKQIATIYDLCYKCNKSGHSASNCALQTENKEEIAYENKRGVQIHS